jgi:hypothetical protein
VVGRTILSWTKTALVGSFVIALAACGTTTPQASVTTGTYSPSAQALNAAAVTAPPPSWKRLDYGGISVAVPNGWSAVSYSSWGSCHQYAIESNTVEMVAGTSEAPVRCPANKLSPPAQPPRTVGLVIDPGPYGPLEHTSSGGSCQGVNGLTICPKDSSYGAPDAYGVLTVAVDVPGASRPVAVEIGLDRYGTLARTILYSIRA